MISGNAYAGKKDVGKGELIFQDWLVDYFYKYIKGKGFKHPGTFVVAIDGSYATYWYCTDGTNCRASNEALYNKLCEDSANVECKVFARQREIRWLNGINPGKGKPSRISSKVDKNQLKARLTELGFYGNFTSSDSITTKEVKTSSQETYLCSVWQASSIKITSQISDKTRCTDIFYKKTDEKVYYTLLPFNNKTISNDKYTSLKNSQTKSYELKGERSIALSWSGYEELIAGTVEFDEIDYKGTLKLPLPNNDGTCEGTYSLQEGGKGTWQIACTNNMGAAGTLKWIKNGSITGLGRDYNDKKVKFTVSKKS